MKIGASLVFSILALNIPCVISSGFWHYLNRHAHSLALHGAGGLQLPKRAAGSTWKYYNVETGNPGSCGSKHVNTDFTVAMNVAQMNPDWCFKTIKLTQGGKSTTATISDTCMGCDYGGIDLTEGLFAFFVGYWPTQGGVLIGDWEFIDDTPPKPSALFSPPPVKTTKPLPLVPPLSTSTVTSHKPVASSAITPSTTRATSTSATANTTIIFSMSASSTSTPSSVGYLSGLASSLAVPTGSTKAINNTSNIEILNSVIIQLGGLVLAAGKD
ncbi:hypothetical protein JR316_0002481 [Psilocybe cubensis]|uniref:Uncharacterized protein n=2 Tax=Psilocybe cubensis TaxID=181762 RepID=A0ACB8HCA6_PSICU|nr:hypothetical protein JR316_0002481 [Psilocybe cubensis]KAH9485571.1 hypothetical protein JR316_0002481 [Psilocybe cubensis]